MLSWLARVVLLLGFALAYYQPVSAHGGGQPQLVNAPAGPFQVSAWTNPDPPQVGELHVTVAVARASTGETITEPQVRVIASPPAGGEAISVIASHEGALTPYFYEADIEFPIKGVWQVKVAIEGAEGSGEASFSLDVREKAVNWLLVGIAGLVVVLVLWMIWLLLRSGSAKNTATS